MNNTEAIANIKKNKTGNLLLDAAELLPANNRKIAIIGKQSVGKSAFINLIAGENVTDGGSIKLPTVLGTATCCDLSSTPTEILNDNCVLKLMREANFLWGIKGSEKKDCQSIEALSESATVDHFGAFRKTVGNAQDAIVKSAHILLAPDCPATENSSSGNTVREIKNVVDVSDILLLVGHPQDFMDPTFHFILTDSRYKEHKTIVLVVIHDQKSNFFHFPFGDDKEADQIEKTRSDAVTRLYDVLNAVGNIEATQKAMRDSIVAETQTLIENIENLAKIRFKKFTVNSVFFFPTDEKESTHSIKEHVDLVNRVHDVQKERIRKTILDMSKSSSIATSSTPYIAWQYFFRKAEDICLDLLVSKILAYKRGCVITHAKLQFFEKNIAIQEKELANILRDYTHECPKIARHILEKYYKDYCEAGKRWYGKDKAVEAAKKELHDFLVERAEYFPLVKRIKNQLAIELPSCEIVLEKALHVAGGDAEKFIQSLERSFNIQTSILNDLGPGAEEKKFLINTIKVELEKQKACIMNDFNYIIDIATLLERADHVQLLSDKKAELENFKEEDFFLHES